MNPFQFIAQHEEELLNTYHDLHALAEPSWKEKKTSAYIISILQKAGLVVKTFPDHFGIIAEIPGTSKKVIALRADMDALVQEVNGEIKSNHSCGHDAHSTMVLYTALALAAKKKQPAHTIRFIFQPAEEKGEGALQMIKDGALKDVRYLFGIHLRPIQEVPYMRASPVIIHGSTGTIKGTIKGLQAHAARPQEGINSIEAAAFLVGQLQKIVLETNSLYSIKMTQLNTENMASNIIPETAVFAIDVRSQTNECMRQLSLEVQNAIELTMKNTGTKISWTIEEIVPAATPNDQAIKIAQAAITSIIGEENAIPFCISQGGEDFHFYTVNNTQLAATMIGLGCGLTPGLHHPQMSFQLDAIIYGTKILIQTILFASVEA